MYNYYVLTLTYDELENLLKITYFKECIDILFKYVIYQKIQEENDIYKTKQNIANILKEYNFNEYPYIKQLLKKLKKYYLKV
jgi:hypothetical protein